MAMNEKDPPSHFAGKEALAHVVEKQKQGLFASQESHGVEPSGFIQAFADAVRETAILLGLFFLFTEVGAKSFSSPIFALFLVGLAYGFWKAGRAAWLGWARLERLHRVVAQEQWEIEHHRSQEREELEELYRAKGFSGKLLDDVVDVLMSDGDRLLRVMVEEELGLSLEHLDHPLKLALGAFLGTLFVLVTTFLASLFGTLFLFVFALFFSLAFSGWITAHAAHNERIPATIWSLAMGAVSFGLFYFLLELLN